MHQDALIAVTAMNDAFPRISGHFLGDLVCPSHLGPGFVVAGVSFRCGPEICIATTDGTAVLELEATWTRGTRQTPTET